MATIRIIFDRQNPVYKCGETICGKIRLCLNAPLTVSEMKISLVGKALVNWVETNTTSKTDDDGHTTTESHSTPFTGSESMDLPTITIWPVDGQLRGSTLSMLGGQHDFSFSFLIPTKLSNLALPGSLVTPMPDGQASISYCIQARVVRSTDRPADLFANEPVVILEYYDLNMDPQASLPVGVTDDQPIECCCLCCCCCGGGQIEVKVRLPKTGYAIGEFLGITAWITSNSHKNAEQVQLQLVQTSTFTATEKGGGIFGSTSTNSSKSVTVLLAQTSKNQPLLLGQTQHWSNEGFVIPEGTRPSMGCGIIKITHHLSINIVPEACFSKFSVMVPVIIGTVPLTPPRAPPGPGSMEIPYFCDD